MTFRLLAAAEAEFGPGSVQVRFRFGLIGPAVGDDRVAFLPEQLMMGQTPSGVSSVSVHECCCSLAFDVCFHINLFHIYLYDLKSHLVIFM